MIDVVEQVIERHPKVKNEGIPEAETMPGVVYPRLISAKGELGPQYPDYNDDNFK